MSKYDEQIIAVSNDDLFQNVGRFQGVKSSNHQHTEADTLYNNIKNTFFVGRRGNLEEDYEAKQPIPYAIIRKGDKVFMYKRLSGSGDERLHDNYSIGVGGHMNNDTSDGWERTFDDLLRLNISREVNEELNINMYKTHGMTFLGMINDDSNDVGKVHLGLLIIIEAWESLSDDMITVKETDVLEGEFVPISDLSNPDIYDKLENWSQIAVDFLDSEGTESNEK